LDLPVPARSVVPIRSKRPAIPQPLNPSAKLARRIARQASTDPAQQVALDAPRRRQHLRQLLAQQRHPAGAAGKENGIDRFRCNARRLQHRLHLETVLPTSFPIDWSKSSRVTGCFNSGAMRCRSISATGASDSAIT
jgi:G3E family GTPase